MSESEGPDTDTGTWWAVDVAGYLLTRLAELADPITPASLDSDEVIAWIRKNELSWAPGCSDLRGAVPWEDLRNRPNDADLVDFVMKKAAEEVTTAIRSDGPDDLCPYSAKRFLSASTLAAYDVPSPPLAGEAPYADGHVHQGAALPFDLTLYWAAGQITGIDRPSESSPALLMEDTDGSEFDSLPLLLLLRAIIEDHEKVDNELLRLAVRAAREDAAAWSELNRRIGFASARGGDLPTLATLETLKREARSPGWDGPRRAALLRVEAILYSGVSQRVAGLDVFVEQFEKLSRVRRKRLPKTEYFQSSIATHVARSGHDLARLELRFGESIALEAKGLRDAENEYLAALQGYLGYIDDKNHPIKVAFPWGLVKSLPNKQLTAENWNYSPRGIYESTELLLDLLRLHPSLAPFIDGLDVCGNEEGDPNWLFAPAFERFAARTQNLAPVPTCRFHAGESQWTPLHGLRRISEFLSFDLPQRVPRRIGHGLALESNDWGRLAVQPIDELLDDLVWARLRLADADRIEPATFRMVDRLILDLRRAVYEEEEARTAMPTDLVKAYRARFDAESLVAISFLERGTEGRLMFPDRRPARREQKHLRLLAAHLAKRPPSASTASMLAGRDVLIGVTIASLQAALSDLYALLAPEVGDDVRWSKTIVEVCPTSNLMVGGVRGHAHHPMRKMVERGILATVNSDDPSIFHSWVPEEFAHARNRMGVPPRQVRSAKRLALREIAPALDTIDLKRELRTAIASLS